MHLLLQTQMPWKTEKRHENSETTKAQAPHTTKLTENHTEDQPINPLDILLEAPPSLQKLHYSQRMDGMGNLP